MNNDDCQYDLLGLLEHRLSPAEERSIEEHLPGCKRCADELRWLQMGHEGALLLPGSLSPSNDAIVRRTIDRIAVERRAEISAPPRRSAAAGIPAMSKAASIVALLGAGWVLGWTTGRPGRAGGEQAGAAIARPVEVVATHAILFLSTDAGAVAPPRTEAHPADEEYARWAATLRSEGRLALAEALGGMGILVQRDDEPRPALAFGPRDPELGVLTGIFAVRAGSDQEAVDMALASPHVRAGGFALVRPVRATERVEPPR